MDKNTLDIRVRAGLLWLMRSIDATGGKGSSHIYSRWRYPLSGWHKGYPETTGYIIETLLDYASLFPDLPLEEYAFSCADWLLTQQLPDGRFPALLADNRHPSTFNSGMIALGLLRIFRHSNQSKYLSSMDKLRTTLHQLLHPDLFEREPAYFTRALWAFALLAEATEDNTLKERVMEGINYWSKSQRVDGTFPHWGFNRSDQAFTHTIAYTLRGLLETSVLHGNTEITQKVALALRGLNTDVESYGELAGMYGPSWSAKREFRCVTGNAQLSIVAYRLWQITNDNIWEKAGKKWMDSILDDQVLQHWDRQLIGAVPGAVPLWGAYMRFKYPNWAVKFYLDGLKMWYLK